MVKRAKNIKPLPSKNLKNSKLLSGRKNYLTLDRIAILLTIIGLLYTNWQIQIAKSAYELNLEPILTVNFDGKNNKLELINDGPITIKNVRIKLLERIFDPISQEVCTASGSERAWKDVKELRSGKHQLFIIDQNDLETFYRNRCADANMRNNPKLMGILLIYTTFEHSLSKKTFDNKKYLWLSKNTNESPLNILDVDKHFRTGLSNLRDALKNFDSKELGIKK